MTVARSECGKTGEQRASLQNAGSWLTIVRPATATWVVRAVRLVSNRAAAASTNRSRFEALDMLQSLARAQRINFRASPKNSYEARDLP